MFNTSQSLTANLKHSTSIRNTVYWHSYILHGFLVLYFKQLFTYVHVTLPKLSILTYFDKLVHTTKLVIVSLLQYDTRTQALNSKPIFTFLTLVPCKSFNIGLSLPKLQALSRFAILAWPFNIQIILSNVMSVFSSFWINPAISSSFEILMMWLLILEWNYAVDGRGKIWPVWT